MTFMELYFKRGLPFKLYKNPAETKEIVQAIGLLKVVVQRAVKKLHQLKNN